MISLVGLHVRCFLRSSMVLEGVVEEWGKERVVLKSLEDQNIIIIHSPSSDIMITKVIENKILKKQETTEIKQEINKSLKDILDNPEDDLKDLKLKHLRSLVIEQEKNIISQKRKEHFSLGKKGEGYSKQQSIVSLIRK